MKKAKWLFYFFHPVLGMLLGQTGLTYYKGWPKKNLVWLRMSSLWFLLKTG